MHQVKLEVFEGPLDLLLHLVRKDEIDIFDISIHQITSQYLEYLSLMERHDLNITSEFLIMAAILIQTKARMLLPQTKLDLEEEVKEEVRTDLTRILLEYKGYKEAAILLKERLQDQEKIYTRPHNNKGDFEIEVGVFDLLSAFIQLLKKGQEEVEEISHDEISVSQRMQELLNCFNGVKALSFNQLFLRKKTKIELIVTFLALLELVRLRRLRISQKDPFSEIWIYKE